MGAPSRLRCHRMSWHCIDCGSDHGPILAALTRSCDCPGRQGLGSSSEWLDEPNPATTTIALPWLKPPLTGNRTRGNPYARANEVKEAKFEAIVAIKAAAVAPMVGAEITLHFRPSDKRRRDADGMFPTLKVCQDALVLCAVIPDDSWVHVPSASCRIHPPTTEPAAMWLTLTDPDLEQP